MDPEEKEVFTEWQKDMNTTITLFGNRADSPQRAHRRPQRPRRAFYGCSRRSCRRGCGKQRCRPVELSSMQRLIYRSVNITVAAAVASAVESTRPAEPGEWFSRGKNAHGAHSWAFISIIASGVATGGRRYGSCCKITSSKQL